LLPGIQTVRIAAVLGLLHGAVVVATPHPDLAVAAAAAVVTVIATIVNAVSSVLLKLHAPL
jgi:hypothetical protein